MSIIKSYNKSKQAGHVFKNSLNLIIFFLANFFPSNNLKSLLEYAISVQFSDF